MNASNWIAFGALSVAVCALIVSFKSCSLSEQSIQHSKETFIAANRPYLIVTPVKSKKSDNYIEASLKEDLIEIKTSYLMRNVGNTPAINISSPTFFALGSISVAKDVTFENLPVMALGPGEEENITMKLTLGSKSGDKNLAPDLLDEINSGKAGIDLGINFSYSSNFTNPETYKYQVTHKLSVNEAKILSKNYK